MHPLSIVARPFEVCFLATTLLLNTSTYAQSPEEIRGMVNAGNYKAALEACEALLDQNPNNIEAIYYAGVCHTHGFSPYKAIEYLEKVAEKNPNLHEELYHTLGIAYHYHYQFDQALAAMEKFMQIPTVKENQFKMTHAQELVDEIKRAKELYQQPSQYYVRYLGDKINTIYSEHSPVLASDQKTLYFTSKEEGFSNSKSDATNRSDYFEDIYEVKLLPDHSFSKPKKVSKGTGASVQVFDKDSKMLTYHYTKGGNLYVSEKNSDGTWSEPYPLKGINTPSSEGHAFIFDQGNAIIFSSNNKTKLGDKDLFISRKSDKNKWEKAIPIQEINTDKDEDSPLVTNQGKTIYFSSRGHGTMGGFDVFRSDYDETTKKWSKPVNLGYPINTPKDDLYFTFDSTGTFGFISSNRDGSLGRRDLYLIGVKKRVKINGKLLGENASGKKVIFKNDVTGQETVATTASDGSFQLGVFNSDSYTISIKENNKIIHEESFRIPVGEQFEVVAKEILLPKNETKVTDNQPEEVINTANKTDTEINVERVSVNIKGLLLNQDGKRIQQANIIIRESKSENILAKANTDNLGKFDVNLQVVEGKSYVIDIENKGQHYKEVKSFIGSKVKIASGDLVDIESVSLDVRLREIRSGDIFVLNNIYFDFNSANLRVESFETLNKLYDMLNSNNNISVKVHGHTDSRGDETYNKWLSTKRAKAIVDYISQKGISSSRLIYEGYGSSKPIAPDDASGYQKNRRCEIEIVKK